MPYARPAHLVAKRQLMPPMQPSVHLPPIPAHHVGDLARQRVRIDARVRLRVDPHRVLRAARTRERPPFDHHARQLVDLVLDALRLDELPLRVGRLEDAAVVHLDAHEPVRHVDVGVLPVVGRPALVREDDFGEEHVRQGVADRLVDEVDARAEGLQSVLLAGGFGLGVADDADGFVGEDDGAVAVGFEVDADVEVADSCVVEMFDAGRGADDRELEDLVDVFG